MEERTLPRYPELGAIVNREIEEPVRKPIGAVSRTPVNVAN